MTLRRNARVCTVIENIRSHFIGVGRTYTISL
jgi:hypothetical protein